MPERKLGGYVRRTGLPTELQMNSVRDGGVVFSRDQPHALCPESALERTGIRPFWRQTCRNIKFRQFQPSIGRRPDDPDQASLSGIASNTRAKPMTTVNLKADSCPFQLADCHMANHSPPTVRKPKNQRVKPSASPSA